MAIAKYTANIVDGALGLTVATGETTAAIIGTTSLGLADTLTTVSSVDDITQSFGIGPACDAAATVINAGGNALLCKVNTETCGKVSTSYVSFGIDASQTPRIYTKITSIDPACATAGTYVKGASGDSVLSTVPNSGFSGTPTNCASYGFIVQLFSTGALGTAIYRWSSDGGTTYSPNIVTPSVPGAHTLGATGISFNWAAGTYTLGDRFYAVYQSPLDDFHVQLLVSDAGTSTTAKVDVSLDGGRTFPIKNHPLSRLLELPGTATSGYPLGLWLLCGDFNTQSHRTDSNGFFIGTGASPTDVFFTSDPSTGVPALDIIILISVGGTLGTAEYQVSTDGGLTFSASAVATTAPQQIGSNNAYVGFRAATYVATTVYRTSTKYTVGATFSIICQAPKPGTPEIANALAAAASSAKPFSLLFIANRQDYGLTTPVETVAALDMSVANNGINRFAHVQIVTETAAADNADAFYKYRYSVDGGTSFTPYTSRIHLGEARELHIPDLGITATIASGAALLTDSYTFNTTILGFGSLLSTAKTSAVTMFNAYRYIRALVDCGPATETALEAIMAAFTSTQVAPCADNCTMQSAIYRTGMVRPIAFALLERAHGHPISQDLARVRTGALTSVLAIDHDERADEGKDALFVSTLQTHIGYGGFFVGNARLAGGASSDYQLLQLGRVIDLACTVSYLKGSLYLSDSVLVNATTGKILESEAVRIEVDINNALQDAIIANGHASDTQVVVNRTDNIISTQKLRYKVRVIPLAYFKAIEVEIALLNPVIST